MSKSTITISSKLESDDFCKEQINLLIKKLKEIGAQGDQEYIRDSINQIFEL